MAIAGTYVWTQNRDEIITDALVNVGAIAPGHDATEARSAGLVAHASRALNRLVKSLDAEGEFLWRVARYDEDTIAGTSTFALSPQLLDIDEPMTYLDMSITSASSTPIMQMSRDDYMLIGDKTQSGVPTRFLVERALSGVTVTLWPVPSVTDDRISYAAYSQGSDFNAGANTPDFPNKWIKALVYGLSADLAPAYGQPTLVQLYQPLFKEEVAKQLSDDTERGNLCLVPWGGVSY
jgi:hypothetical protein